jgi:energy-coupling factor transporter ATP-binding protein EcfA2
MSIAGAYLRGFEPFNDQALEFKEKVSSGLADVHFFVGQNGTGKTRLLSLLASACGNPEELQFRNGQSSSIVVATVMESGAEKLRAYSTQGGGLITLSGPVSAAFTALVKQQINPHVANPSLVPVSTTVAMAFRSIPSLEDQKVAPMAEVKWPEAKAFLKFAHHSSENVQLCQALANLKVRMGIVSSDPNDRTVRMVQAFDKAIQTITSSDLVLTVGYIGKDFRLKASWLGKEMQLRQLPDGLRSIVGWLASVVCKLDVLLPDTERPLEQPIILLLDEPDAHLHPAWQRKLIPAVQHLLPKAQIFVATHSPFVISSVNAGWIYIFEANSDGKVTIKPPIACSQGDSYIDVVEDVLGIKERFDPETEDLLRDFRSKRDALKRQSAPELTELQALADRIAKRGDTLQFMMGREMAQLKSQLQAAAT